MPNRAETVIDTVKTLLTGLTTTGANVFIEKTEEFTDAQVPGLNITIGDRDPMESSAPQMSRWSQEVLIEIKVKTNTDYWQTVMDIEAEIHAALRADHTLGLSFVNETAALGAQRMEVDGDHAKIMTNRIMGFMVMFETNRDDLTS